LCSDFVTVRRHEAPEVGERGAVSAIEPGGVFGFSACSHIVKMNGCVESHADTPAHDLPVQWNQLE
jgi:hypothetical protein